MRIYKKSKKSNYSLKILGAVIIAFWVIIIFTQIFGIIEKKLVYPIKYYEYVSEYSKEFGVEEALVLATVKVESNFNQNAKSEKGALGLMQIKKETGEYIAEILGEKEFDLFEPKTNIRFGIFYLKYLFEKFNNIDTVICAYNAGEGNVSSWLKDQTNSKDGVTLKTVPFKETENYLIKIKKCYKKYKNLYSKILDKKDNIE